MNAKQLLDSRKFCLLATDFAKTWLDKKASEDDKEMRLEAVLTLLDVSRPQSHMGEVKPFVAEFHEDTFTASTKPKRAYNRKPVTASEAIAKEVKKRKKNAAILDQQPADKKALLDSMRAPISAAEAKALRQEAESNKQRDPQLVVNDAVEQVIKPNWSKTDQDGAGTRHFLVNTRRNNENVSFDKEKWDTALKLHGIPGVFTACKPENAGIGAEAKSVNRWRVMIG